MTDDLYTATKELHHACEQHPTGQRMAEGSVTPGEWADWLGAFQTLHDAIDHRLPVHMWRSKLLRADLSVLPVPVISPTAFDFARRFKDVDSLGIAYVLHGAHCSGGRILAPKLVKRGLPSGHVLYRYRDAVKAWLAETRARGEFAWQARQTFACLLGVMTEIEERHHDKAR